MGWFGIQLDAGSYFCMRDGVFCVEGECSECFDGGWLRQRLEDVLEFYELHSTLCAFLKQNTAHRMLDMVHPFFFSPSEQLLSETGGNGVGGCHSLERKGGFRLICSAEKEQVIWQKTHTCTSTHTSERGRRHTSTSTRENTCVKFTMLCWGWGRAVWKEVHLIPRMVNVAQEGLYKDQVDFIAWS